MEHIDDNTLLLAKAKTGTMFVSSEHGIFTTSMPPIIALEVKEQEVNDWLDEHGVDAYDAPEAKLKDFEIEIGLVCKGTAQECSKSYSDLVNFCTRNHTEMLMASTWTMTGKAGVYYVKATVPEVHSVNENETTFENPDGSEDMAPANGARRFSWEWTVTFRVTKPESEVSVEKNAAGQFTLTQTS